MALSGYLLTRQAVTPQDDVVDTAALNHNLVAQDENQDLFVRIDAPQVLDASSSLYRLTLKSSPVYCISSQV